MNSLPKTLGGIALLAVFLAGIFYAIRLGREDRRALAPAVQADASRNSHEQRDISRSNPSARQPLEATGETAETADQGEEAEDVREQGGLKLQFRVLHPNGQAAASAAVLIVQSEPPPSERSGLFLGRSFFTDDHGRLELTVESMSSKVLIYPPRWTAGVAAPEPVTFEPNPEGWVDLGDIHLKSVLGPTVVGQVVDGSGVPIPGLELVLRQSIGSEQAALSDHSGRFEFPNVRNGQFQISYLPEVNRGGRGDAMGLLPGPLPVTVNDNSPSILDAGTMTVYLDPTVYALHVHPPQDVLPSTVSARVTSAAVPEGQTVPLTVDAFGVATWNPWSEDHGLTQVLRVQFERRSGPDKFETTFTIQPGKIDRIFIP